MAESRVKDLGCNLFLEPFQLMQPLKCQVASKLRPELEITSNQATFDLVHSWCSPMQGSFLGPVWFSLYSTKMSLQDDFSSPFLTSVVLEASVMTSAVNLWAFPNILLPPLNQKSINAALILIYLQKKIKKYNVKVVYVTLIQTIKELKELL